MIELVELEKRHEDFSQRKARVIVISMEGQEDAEKTQKQLPHLLVLADKDRGLSRVADVIHAKASPEGEDADAPTTILVDRDGKVRWVYRSPLIVARLSPDEVLQAVDKYLVKGP